MELLAAVNKTESPDAETVLQDNLCSFGTLVFELKSTAPFPPPGKRKRSLELETVQKRDHNIAFGGCESDILSCYCASVFLFSPF